MPINSFSIKGAQGAGGRVEGQVIGTVFHGTYKDPQKGAIRFGDGRPYLSSQELIMLHAPLLYVAFYVKDITGVAVSTCEEVATPTLPPAGLMRADGDNDWQPLAVSKSGTISVYFQADHKLFEGLLALHQNNQIM